jgi:hypothetical protein|tara:strand:- start:89 stop:409 length:321 start_codon:yes stop_codon:yes gene_type:complete
LKEYGLQVPLEFDFKREASMLTVVGGAISTRKGLEIATPKVVPGMSENRVLTMTFVEGESLGDIIQRSLRAGGGFGDGTGTALRVSQIRHTLFAHTRTRRVVLPLT